MAAQQPPGLGLGLPAQQHQMTPPAARPQTGAPEIAAAEILLPVPRESGELGDGHFGVVYRGQCRGLNVAVKMLKVETVDATALQSFRAEVNTMAQVYHPNVCMFLGACFEPDNLMIVTELCEGGDVQTLLRSAEPLTLLQRVRMCSDAARGIRWLHEGEPRVIHRDIKTSNLLLDENRRVKVCDFGLSQLIPQNKKMRDLRRAKGTPLYMSPEVMLFRPFDERSDTYSFGIVMWEIFTRTEPFLEFTAVEEFRTAVTQNNVRPAIPAEIPEELARLMEWCWHGEPSARPAMRDVDETLESVALALAIPADDAGRNFWQMQFGMSDHVSKERLLNALMTHVGFARGADLGGGGANSDSGGQQGGQSVGAVDLDPAAAAAAFRADVEFRLLKTLLDDISRSQNTQNIAVEHFGQLLNWFGPLDPHMLSRIYDVASQPWFHGAIEKEDAEARVKGVGVENTFLVRLSTSSAGCFTLSYMSGTVKHKRLQFLYNPDGSSPRFVLGNVEYPSLMAIIQATELYPPAPGSKFQAILDRNGAELNTSSGYE
jgi:serine/threonine protein kinase